MDYNTFHEMHYTDVVCYLMRNYKSYHMDLNELERIKNSPDFYNFGTSIDIHHEIKQDFDDSYRKACYKLYMQWHTQQAKINNNNYLYSLIEKICLRLGTTVDDIDNKKVGDKLSDFVLVNYPLNK